MNQSHALKASGFSRPPTGIWAMDNIMKRKDLTIYGHGYYH